ncbi:MAG: glutathione S-transferase N-terminal domain-containing protein [Gaiellaceae bacterium]
MAVKLHRCRWTSYRYRHPCWTVQEALDDAGIGYEIVAAPTFPRGRRKELVEHTGQHFLPAIEFEDGSWYREDSNTMAAEIRAGRLAEKNETGGAGGQATP